MPGGVEIERKFLVDQLPAGLDWLDDRPLRQGYVALDGDTEVRVRDDAGSWRLTVKHGGGLRRVEEDIEIDERRGEALWDLTEGRRVEKRRHRLALGDALLEVDVFEGDLQGLVVAEVEFDGEDAARAFSPPEWFGREVTDDGAYKNRALAVEGRPT
ncbi:MAG: adenylate cyclase [Solirubrobacteraceae bacterium]|nr:adenylate cyclase [Solirubrobacteraceae bacterium]